MRFFVSQRWAVFANVGQFLLTLGSLSTGGALYRARLNEFHSVEGPS